MKNIIIIAPARSGKSYLAHALQKEFSGKIDTIIVADEVLGDLPNDYLYIGLGYAESTVEQQQAAHKDAMSAERIAGLIEMSKRIKDMSQKHGFAYFDTAKFSADEINRRVITHLKSVL